MNNPYRAVFISDVHLGTRACQAGQLLDFLHHHPSDNLFLIGDIVDFWAMGRTIRWAPEHNTVVQKILRRARKGDNVVFIPGNHDEVLRDYTGVQLGEVRIEKEWIYNGVDGRNYWLVHGDEFDQVTLHHRWVAMLGDVGYNALVRLNNVFSRIRRLLGIRGYWSLAGYAKQKVKKALDFIFEFERAIVRATRQRGLDGVICGHIHWAADRMIGDIRYMNCGDWVDSCSALVEHHDGRIEIVRWLETRSDQLTEPTPLPVSRAA